MASLNGQIRRLHINRNILSAPKMEGFSVRHSAKSLNSTKVKELAMDKPAPRGSRSLFAMHWHKLGDAPARQLVEQLGSGDKRGQRSPSV
jgi:hypothetical protein